ncbi:hypothetical protein FRX31_017554 [Thalictrum thalictroides]|uniref:Uncharacterized protein n=1 Tax=Thalictrum thalictroides TaxID=46969 RepID=A0A7J6W646_THATH|nr:hypothetical protein FRX31_017554 [Thalictrum thalictroides]
MRLTKRYILHLFISLKYIIANVVDRYGQIVATMSTVEHALKEALSVVALAIPKLLQQWVKYN